MEVSGAHGTAGDDSNALVQLGRSLELKDDEWSEFERTGDLGKWKRADIDGETKRLTGLNLSGMRIGGE